MRGPSGDHAAAINPSSPTGSWARSPPAGSIDQIWNWLAEEPPPARSSDWERTKRMRPFAGSSAGTASLPTQSRIVSDPPRVATTTTTASAPRCSRLTSLPSIATSHDIAEHIGAGGFRAGRALERSCQAFIEI